MKLYQGSKIANTKARLADLVRRAFQRAVGREPTSEQFDALFTPLGEAVMPTITQGDGWSDQRIARWFAAIEHRLTHEPTPAQVQSWKDKTLEIARATTGTTGGGKRSLDRLWHFIDTEPDMAGLKALLSHPKLTNLRWSPALSRDLLLTELPALDHREQRRKLGRAADDDDGA